MMEVMNTSKDVQASTKRCPDCVTEKPGTEFSVVTRSDGRQRLVSYCKPCQSARSRDGQRRRGAAAVRSIALAYAHENQSASTGTASNHGRRWTGPELEVAMRPDLTAEEVSAMLGRTYYAVCRARIREGNYRG